MWRRRDGLGFPLGKAQKAVARTSNEDNRATGSLTFKQRNLYWRQIASSNQSYRSRAPERAMPTYPLILRSIKIRAGLSRNSFQIRKRMKR